MTMSSVSTPTKPMAFVENVRGAIRCPFFDKDGFLQFLSNSSGDVFTVNEQRTPEVVCNSGGQPSGAVLDSKGALLIADFAHGAIISIDKDGRHQVVVRVYEDKPFKGPNSLACDSQGTIYFTDSGPVGETGLHNPKGSLYCITEGPSGQLLKPIALESLAYPSGVCVSPDNRCVYVCEQAANRVLRFVQSPHGAHHYTVLCQLSGGFGPTAITCDQDGHIYVARYDFAGLSNVGLVTVLGSDGIVQQEFELPGPEVSGLAISPDGRGLFVTECSTNTVYRISIG